LIADFWKVPELSKSFLIIYKAADSQIFNDINLQICGFTSLMSPNRQFPFDIHYSTFNISTVLHWKNLILPPEQNL